MIVKIRLGSVLNKTESASYSCWGGRVQKQSKLDAGMAQVGSSSVWRKIGLKNRDRNMSQQRDYILYEYVIRNLHNLIIVRIICNLATDQFSHSRCKSQRWLATVQTVGQWTRDRCSVSAKQCFHLTFVRAETFASDRTAESSWTKDMFGNLNFSETFKFNVFGRWEPIIFQSTLF